MLHWYIAMGDRQAPLESVEVPAIRAVTDPIRDHIAARLGRVIEGEHLTVVFVVEEDRSLSIRLTGDQATVNEARDILSEEEQIGPLLM